MAKDQKDTAASTSFAMTEMLETQQKQIDTIRLLRMRLIEMDLTKNMKDMGQDVEVTLFNIPEGVRVILDEFLEKNPGIKEKIL